MAPRFTIPPSKKKPAKSNEGIDVAARYLVYKLHVPGQAIERAWQPVSQLGESAATIDRAVERGWVTIRPDEGKGKARERYAALTDQGRILARKALR